MGTVTPEVVAQLTANAYEVGNWKSLQAAIDAGSTVNTNSVDYGIDHMNGTFDEGAVFDNGSSAMHFETTDNSNAATVIFGSMEIGGEIVHDVVIYSSNPDLIMEGTAKTTVEADFDTHGDRTISDYTSITTDGGVKFIVEQEYLDASSFVNFTAAFDSKLEAYVEGYKDGYAKGYDDGYADGYSDGFDDGVASVK